MHTRIAQLMMVFCETVANSDYIANKNGRVLNFKINRFANFFLNRRSVIFQLIESIKIHRISWLIIIFDTK